MKMTILVALMAILSPMTMADSVDGNLTLRDGRRVVRINIGKEDRSTRQMSRRIRRLEEAVRDLQDTVYDLQVSVPTEEKYSCKIRTCRASTSIHSASAHNCSFFGMWKNEKVDVWAMSGSEAERVAMKKISADRDVKQVSGTASCSVK